MTIRQMLLGAIGACVLLPSAAQARIGIIAPFPPIPIDPPYCPDPPPGYTYRWIPPVYRTLYDRVWVDERMERVLEWVQITPDRWERVWRTVVIPAHWETTTRRELVREGRWELVRITPPIYKPPIYPRPIPLPRPVATPGTVGVEGYSRTGGEDLSKFSPLSEWPEKK